MNEKFTPANWQIDEYGDILQAKTERLICCFIPSRNDVDEANKRLVVKSPNLYNKLLEAVSYLENGFTSNTERRLFVSGIKELLREVTPDFFEDGTPKDNNYQYCPHCGRRISREIRDYED